MHSEKGPDAMRRRFSQVDVFTSVPCMGNPLAVVLDAGGLSDAQMHAFTRWTNLSETTFVLPPTTPEADYRVRIFSPGTEFPFAGHPTLGTAHALLASGLVPRVPGRLVQECGVGLVPIDIASDGALAFKSPEAQLRGLHPGLQPTLQAALGGTTFRTTPAPAIASMGISWLVVRLDSAQAVLDMRPDGAALAELLHLGVAGVAAYGPHPPGGPADYEVRVLFTKLGVLSEDPVTGSANACIARVLQAQGFPDGPGGYTVRQGTALRIDGRVAVSYRGDAPWIGGHAVTVIEGTVLL